MATNNIKIFDQNKANMLTDEAYNTSTQRLNGVQQGIASSQLQNKTLYQVSLVAYSIGQMMQANGLDANDANVVSTFAGNLSNTIVQKILDKASTTEAKNFTVNNKFITPQTWKAAYDFMKADSDMVNSAVDDTHYITPKLLKEGAEKYGDKVRLDDGNLVSGINLGSLDVAKYNKTFSSYPVLNNKSYIIYSNDTKTIHLVNTLNKIVEIASVSFSIAPIIKFADEEWLIVNYVENNAMQIVILHLENDKFVQKLKQTMPAVSSSYYYSVEYIIPSFVNCTNNVINLMLHGSDRNSNNYIKVATYNKSANAFTYADLSDLRGGSQVSYWCFMNTKQQIACCYASSYSSSTSHTTNIVYVNNLVNVNTGYVSISTSSSSYDVVRIYAYYKEYIYAGLQNSNIIRKIKISDNTFEEIDTTNSNYKTTAFINNLILVYSGSISSLMIINKDTNETLIKSSVIVPNLPIGYVSASNNAVALGFAGSQLLKGCVNINNFLFINVDGFFESYSIKILGFK